MIEAYLLALFASQAVAARESRRARPLLATGDEQAS